MAFTYEYPRPAITVDCVVFGLSEPVGYLPPTLEVLLVRRKDEPFKGRWALPGGHVHMEEGLEEAAQRELKEETGVQINYLEQLYTFGKPGRDPRGRVISVAYFALVRSKDHIAQAGSDASEAQWFSMTSALVTGLSEGGLAFDHAEILDMAFKRLQMKVRYAPLGFNLLPAKFSLSQLQALYEGILGRPLDKRNFRKRILSMGILKEVGVESGSGRPGPAAQLFRFDKKAYDLAVKNRFNFEI